MCINDNTPEPKPKGAVVRLQLNYGISIDPAVWAEQYRYHP